MDAFRCPRCGKPLADGGPGILACLRCGGAFVATGRVVAASKTTSPHLAATATTARRTEPCVACPVCLATTRRHRVGDVTVDTCTLHGHWFDRGELATVDARALTAARSALYPAGTTAPTAPSAAPAEGDEVPPLGLRDWRQWGLGDWLANGLIALYFGAFGYSLLAALGVFNRPLADSVRIAFSLLERWIES